MRSIANKEAADMKLAADYRALARDALRGRWKTAVLAGFSWVVAAFSDAAAMGVALVTLLAVPLSAGFFVVRPYEEAAWAVFYRDITAAEAETE